MELLINKILSIDIHEAIVIYEKDLKKLGKQLYGINCGSCGNRLIEIYIKLNKNGKQILYNMKTRTAQLKKGVVLEVPQMGITWTNEAIDFTDEKAVKVLEKYGALAARFEVLPSMEPKLDRDALKAEAKELKLEYKSNLSTVKLNDLVQAKKAEVTE